MLDLQSLWEMAQREISLEGSNGCTLSRLWQLVGLDQSTADASRKHKTVGGGDSKAKGYLKQWLWR